MTLSCVVSGVVTMSPIASGYGEEEGTAETQVSGLFLRAKVQKTWKNKEQEVCCEKTLYSH